MVGRLQSVELRNIWCREARDFTPWLFDNLDVLNETVGLSISALEMEKSVGPFSVDIWAEDQNGPVVIENQIEKTDHDHLGKLLTYMSNLDAKTAIWISSDPRQEHIKAIEYLNEVLPDDTRVFLIRIQAYCIGQSEAAPLFTIVAGPNDTGKIRGGIKKGFAKENETLKEFFTQLLEESNKRTSLFKNVSPVGYQGFLDAGAGRTDMGYTFTVNKSDARVQFAFWAADSDLNKSRFRHLEKQKSEIEAQFGSALVWDCNEGRRNSYIRSPSDIGGFQNQEKWPALKVDLVDRMVRLESALKDRLASLP